MASQRRHLNIVPELGSAPDTSSVAALLSQSMAGGLPLETGELLQVGELAKVTGKTVRAIHLYEDLGLIAPVKRSKGRYRLFAPETKTRISWIGKLQSLGLSLTEIQAIVVQRDASHSAERAAAELRIVYAERLAQVREAIVRYRALETELQASLAFLDACQHVCQDNLDAASCPSCERHGEARKTAPELIAGAQFVRGSA